MVEVYTHTLTGDSAEDIEMLYGVNLKGGKKKRNERLQQEMVGPHCPFCHTVNIPGIQFCSSCHKPLASVSVDAIMKEAEERKKEIEQMQQNQQRMWDNMTALQGIIDSLLRQRGQTGTADRAATAWRAEEEMWRRQQ